MLHMDALCVVHIVQYCMMLCYIYLQQATRSRLYCTITYNILGVLLHGAILYFEYIVTCRLYFYSIILLMDKILHETKDPKLWELWCSMMCFEPSYIHYMILYQHASTWMLRFMSYVRLIFSYAGRCRVLRSFIMTLKYHVALHQTIMSYTV